MENTPTSSNSPSSLSSTVLLLGDLQGSLELSLENDKLAAPEDTAFGSFLDRQILLQEANSLCELRCRLDVDPADPVAAANYARILSLFERTRARISRDENVAARTALRELELAQRDVRPMPEREEAAQFLQTELSGGDRPAKELIDLARSIGISHSTLKRAKADLNIRSLQVPHAQSTRSWLWSLPSSSASSSTPTAAATPTTDLAWHSPTPAAPSLPHS